MRLDKTMPEKIKKEKERLEILKELIKRVMSIDKKLDKKIDNIWWKK